MKQNKLDDSELIKMVAEFKVFQIMKLDLMIESQTRIYLLPDAENIIY